MFDPGALPAASDAASALAPEQYRRYARHLSLKEVGRAGQRRLLSGRVLVAGVTGRGGAAATYLAAAGVGTLGLLDARVAASGDPAAAPYFAVREAGLPLAEAARESLEALNPDVRVAVHRTAHEIQDWDVLFRGYPVVLDGSPDAAGRRAVCRAARAAGIPSVTGAFDGRNGWVSVLLPPPHPAARCLACADPGPSGPDSEPSDAAAQGLLGSLQAVEILKWILGQGALLAGRRFVYEAGAGDLRAEPVVSRADCTACASSAGTPR